MSRILIVDDERGVRALCTDLLRRSGYQAEAVESGAAALALLEEERFDLVLLDINLPMMSGIELCRRVRQRWPEQRVVLITGCPSIDTAVRGLGVGACDYLCKPFTPERLRRMIAETLEGRAAQRLPTTTRAGRSTSSPIL